MGWQKAHSRQLVERRYETANINKSVTLCCNLYEKAVRDICNDNCNELIM